MAQGDVRWAQRFEHFAMGLAQLEAAESLAQTRELSPLEAQGFIKAFEFTFEQSWLTLKDFLQDRGVQGLYGSKDAVQEAFRTGLIRNGQLWMDMIQSRNLTSHTYDEAAARKILAVIRQDYLQAFRALRATLADRISETASEGPA